MKKNIFIKTLCVVALLVSLSSCKRMLEEDTYGAFTEEAMLGDENNLVLIVGQAYADVKWLHDHWGYWGINTLTSDECVNPVRNPGNHWADGGYWADMNKHTWTSRSTAFENVWNQSIWGAVLCNKIIQMLDDNKATIADNLYNQYKGELDVLRSYYFYTLFDCFGRIPYTEVFAENKSVPLMSPEDVWQKLVDCLERNAPNLPVINDGNRAQWYGRASQGLAYALLARLYLNAESYGVADANAYNKCVHACDEVINSGAYHIEDDFFTNFKIKNETSRENIFVIVEDGNENFDARSQGSMSNKLRITMLSLHYNHQQAWNLLEKPWNGFCAPQDFIARYQPGDLRGPCNPQKGTNNDTAFGWFLGPIWNPDNSETILKDENGTEANIVAEVSSLTDAKWYEGARFLKYEVDKTATYKFCENDFVLFRYADVLYMKAEAILRGGSGSIDYSGEMAKIRTRAGMPAYTTLDLEEILNERGREFAWENVRRRDLIRYNKFGMGAWFGKTRQEKFLDWFPIPQAMLDKSEIVEGKNIWTQNPGY
jgi:hypothetical protein